VRLVALALTLAGPAALDGVDVQWAGDPTCPSDQFRRSLAGHLAGVAAGPPIRVVVTVRAQQHAWSAELALTTPDGPGVRSVSGPTCASVSAAAAFITALVVDPDLRVPEPAPAAARPPPDPVVAPPAEPAPSPSPEPVVAPPAEPAPSPSPSTATTDLAPDPIAAQPRPAPSRSPPRRVRGFLRLAGGLEALGLPRVGPQLSPGVGLIGPRWRVELGAVYRAPTRATSAVAPDVGGAIRLWALGLRGCGVVHPRPLEVPLCLGVEAGQARGDGFGVDDPQRVRLPWLAVTAGPALAWAPRPWIAVWLGLDVAVPLIRARFAVENLGDIHQPAPASLRAALGLESRF
jgi:hypothetical protein